MKDLLMECLVAFLASVGFITVITIVVEYIANKLG